MHARPLKLSVRRFGPRLDTKARVRAGMNNDGGHAGCWINSWCCGPDCIMADHDGSPSVELREWRTVYSSTEL